MSRIQLVEYGAGVFDAWLEDARSYVTLGKPGGLFGGLGAIHPEQAMLERDLIHIHNAVEKLISDSGDVVTLPIVALGLIANMQLPSGLKHENPAMTKALVDRGGTNNDLHITTELQGAYELLALLKPPTQDYFHLDLEETIQALSNRISTLEEQIDLALL